MIEYGIMKNKIRVPVYFACYKCDYKVLAQKKMTKEMTEQALKAFIKVKRHLVKEHAHVQNPADFEKIANKKKPFWKLF